MIIDAITVAVNYHDYLVETLPRNRPHFNRFTVVCGPDDNDTLALCATHDTIAVTTTRLQANGASFNKGCALNDGIEALRPSHWVTLLDADTVVPADCRVHMEACLEDQSQLFGTRRHFCPTMELWQAHLSGKSVRFAESVDDIAGHKMMGPGATGYFVAVHASAIPIANSLRWFSENFPSAGWVDVEFAKRWGFSRRWLPFEVIHLGLPKRNWRSRTTPKFS